MYKELYYKTTILLSVRAINTGLMLNRFDLYVNLFTSGVLSVPNEIIRPVANQEFITTSNHISFDNR